MATDEEKKEIVEKVLLEFEKLLAESYMVGALEINELIKKIKRDYDLLPKYPTLREYISENARGSYHHFVFFLHGIKVDVSDIQDFELYFQPHWLDDYVVTEAEKSDNGGNCESYQARHKLIIEKKEKE